jgi:hypothetical protein
MDSGYCVGFEIFTVLWLSGLNLGSDAALLDKGLLYCAVVEWS